jgi:hypothetical protein
MANRIHGELAYAYGNGAGHNSSSMWEALLHFTGQSYYRLELAPQGTDIVPTSTPYSIIGYRQLIYCRPKWLRGISRESVGGGRGGGRKPSLDC